MKKLRIAALALAAAVSVGTLAPARVSVRTKSAAAPKAPKDESIILNMQQALSIALEKNLTVLTAQQDVEGAKGRAKAAAGALNPYLSLQGQGNAYDKVPNMPDNELIASAGLSQSLYSGGANQARSRQGVHGVRQAEQQLAETRETVALTVWNAFCETLYRREALRNARNALDYYINAERELNSRVMYGLSTNLDLTRVRQQKENARAQHIAAGNELHAARIELCRLLRLPPETDLSLAGSLEDGLPTVEEARRIPLDAEKTIQAILASRGDYQALVHAAKASELDIIAAKAGMLPSLTLSGGYRFGYRARGLSAGMGRPSDDNQWTASLSLDVPVWDGGITSGNVKAARAGLRAAENAVAEKEESIRAQLADDWLSLLNTLETLSASRANVQLARESLDYAESGYREGVNTQLDVLQARSDLTSALQQLALALRDARQAQGSLWKSEGVFVLRAMAQVPVIKPAAEIETATKKK